jgi:hypothetical protein
MSGSFIFCQRNEIYKYIKISGKLMLNFSKYNFTDSAVAVLKEVGTTGSVIQSPTKGWGV